MSLNQLLIAGFQSEVPATRRMLEAAPLDRADWRPHEKSMTLGRLVGHIAEIPGLVSMIMEREMDFASPAAQSFKPFTATNTADLLRFFDQNVKGAESALAAKDDAFLSATWSMRRGEKVFLSLPRQAAMRSVVIQHGVHHRGQLSVYLRLLGVPVPSSYGPTADYPMM